MPRRKSGPTQPEAERAAKQVLLRLPPEVAAELRRRGREHPRGASGVVAGLLGPPATRYELMKAYDDATVDGDTLDAHIAGILAVARVAQKKTPATPNR